MDFSSGNSGNQLFDTVTKFGEGCQQEGSFCEYLGKTVCPKIYAIIPQGYTMEKLQPAPRVPELILEIEELLEHEVWNRPALPWSMDTDWRDKLKVYGITTPDWVAPSDYCLVHGDPTASNALRRGHELIMCDPRPPRDFIPQCKETDMGRLLQSMFGWEVVAYGAEPVTWKKPRFFSNPIELKQATFWCGAAAARIAYLERSRISRSRILQWCRFVMEHCYEHR